MDSWPGMVILEFKSAESGPGHIKQNTRQTAGLGNTRIWQKNLPPKHQIKTKQKQS